MKELSLIVTAILASAWTATASDTNGNGFVAANKAANALVSRAYPKTTGNADAQLPEGLMSTNGLLLNFHNVPLKAVLSYLGSKTGLIIVSEVDLQGRVNIVAERPVGTNEIVDLLSAQLAKNNYAVALAGRTLTIMDAALAKTSALIPVIVNKSGPKQIPMNDGIVTEILPVHSLQPAQLVKDLTSLIPAGDTVSVSEAGNAIIMTASQKDVRRISEIISALDGFSISDVEVFVLRYAEAKSLVSELKDIFQTSDSGAGLSNSRNDFGGAGGPVGPGGGGPPGFPGGEGFEEKTKNAQTHAVFVSDDQMNAIIASAPPAYMNTVSNLIAELDQPRRGITEIHVLRLKQADPGEIADEISSLFPSGNAGSDQTSQSTGFQFDPPRQASADDSGQSPRMKRQSTVLAVADRRTQSVIVTASKEMMKQIREMVQELDRGGQGVQKIAAIDFGSADPATVQESLSGLFSSANSPSASSTLTGTPLANRYSGNANSQSSTSSSTTSVGASGAGTSGAH